MDRPIQSLVSLTVDPTHLSTVGEVLVERGDINGDQLREALMIQTRGSQRLMLGEILINEGMVTPDRLLSAIAHSKGLQFVSDPRELADAGARALLPQPFRTQHNVLPLGLDSGELRVCTGDPDDFFVIDEMQKLTGFRVRLVVSTPEAIAAVLRSEEPDAEAPSTGVTSELIDSIIEGFDESTLQVDASHAADMAESEPSETSGPVVRLVNFIICAAVKEGASDIHIEPDEGSLRVRLRIDGTLYQRLTPPHRMHAAISSRIKIMAKLDISERRVPQDGEISVRIEGKAIDLRVSTLPGKFGEKTVMRVIDRSGSQIGLEKLGFRPEMLQRFHHLISEPHGVVLVSGPTGSGKSTTLYSALSQFDTMSLNISTVEDPVESNLAGVHQTQTNNKAGLTFASALRALLRQDPDIIMVGEIRDAETAQVAVQAALTGHLVFSTLHTNDAPSATTRLVNLGVEPFLVAAALRGVLAQRLVRRVCSGCREEYVPDGHVRASMGKYGAQAERLWRGHGCKRCHESGCAGRVGLYELFIPDQKILEAITARVDHSQFRLMLDAAGFESIWDDGMMKVLAGATTVEEVHSACRH
ncbi:MAG: type II/IV secretion system protein [Phycisphaerales bacterium]|nr:type II/IV secretion system protein [Phycisphaerales bacterium]